MGDRGNIVMQYEGGQHIFFYGHWSGSALGRIVHAALKKRERWDDDAYLARIIFCELVGEDDGTTGFGISPSACDNEYDYLIVDVPGQRVVRAKGASLTVEKESWTFEEFIKAAPIDEW